MRHPSNPAYHRDRVCMAAIGRNGGAHYINGDNGGDVVETQDFASLRCYQANPARQQFLHHALFDLAGFG